MRIDINPKTQRALWLERRREGLGSSDVPAIVLPYNQRPKHMSPWKVWDSKVNGREEEVESSFMDFGNRFERSVAEYVAEKEGKALAEGGWYRRKDKRWMMASPDFWLEPIMDVDGIEDGEREGVECKVIQNSQNAGDWLPGSAPPHVTIQAHWCMAVTGAKRWHICALIWFSQEFRHYTVEYDEDFANQIIHQAANWWQVHVEGEIEPPIDHTDACKEIIQRNNPEHDSTVREANDVEEKLLKDYGMACEMFKHAEAHKKQCENLLKTLTSGNRGITSESGGRFIWSNRKGKAGLDQKALKEAHPDIFEKFTKRGSDYRAIRYTKPKV